MIAIQDLPAIYTNLRDRYSDRDVRMEKLDRIVKGDFSVFDPDEESVTSRSPNLVQVALEDTAEAASLMPTIRVTPYRQIEQAKRTASRMEKVAAGYFDFAEMDLLTISTVMDLAAFGFCPWVVLPSFADRLPLIEKRDPRTCYPEPGFQPGSVVNRCVFAREMHFTQLPAVYQEKLVSVELLDDTVDKFNARVLLVEYYDADETVIAVLYETQTYAQDQTYFPVELDRIPNKSGVCPVVIGSRFALDGEFRGQFDQILGVLEAHIRLMGLILDYADQAVYSDVWVKDLIGELSWGGGAYIELGPQGAIGRVPPAVNALNVQQDLDRLVDAIHVGGRWPKSRPGEIDQAIASAKFIEATAGMMNTAIKTYHQILKRMMEHALRVCFTVDKAYFPGEKVAHGVLRNQEFVESYDVRKDIDLRNHVKVEYGVGLGRDPAQSAVLMLQYASQDDPYLSHEFVMENIEGLTDVNRERIRLDVEQFNKMLKAKLLEGLQTGMIPQAALLDIVEAREKGEDLASLYRKYVVQPQEEAAAGPQSGLTGQPLGAPGVGAPPGAPVAPGAPGLPAGAPPPPPDAAGLLNRLTQFVPGTGMLGAQVGRG